MLTPRVVMHQQYLGGTVIPIRHLTYKRLLPVLFVHLHHNEKTAADIADSVSRQTGIEFLQIINNEKRLLDFIIDDDFYRVDPNRIFSRDGTIASLNRLSKASEEALVAIDSFQRFLNGFFDRTKTVVALHNNTDGEFSMENYRQSGTGSVYQNPQHDPDDFFITTDASIFDKLRERGYNVVLEDINTVVDDGSLSVYCAKNGIRYVNIEAQHGHYREQRNMVEILLQILAE